MGFINQLTEEARTCEAWFQLTFRPQKWNLKVHKWYQLSPFPSSNVAICDAARPRQHSPILRYSALLRYSVLCFNSITHVIWHDIETMAGVRKPSIRHPATYFPKQIPTPSRFKLILLINNGIDWKDHDSCSFWAENFGRSLEGQGGPTRGSKVFNTIIQMEAGHLREKPTNSSTARNTSSNHLRAAKGWWAFLFSGKQSSHQTQRNNKKLTSSGFKQQPICTPLAPTRSKIIYKTACSRQTQFWVRKTFSKPASLKRASLVACPVAISRKVSLKPKHCASATLIQKTLKNEPKHGPTNGTAWRSIFGTTCTA